MVNTRRTTDNYDPTEEKNHEEMMALRWEDLNQLINRAI